LANGDEEFSFMSALYRMCFGGVANQGGGCIYVGNGKIFGADGGGVLYRGSYTERAGEMHVSVTLSAVADAVKLVTGYRLAKGENLPLSAKWPCDFANGVQQIQVGGKTVDICFEKIGDI
jgi:hypothetical protein